MVASVMSTAAAVLLVCAAIPALIVEARADAPAVAPADPGASSVQLVYVRGSGTELCPDEETLRDDVGARLGYDPFDAEAKTKVIARITRESGALRGLVEVVDGEGSVTGSRVLSSTKNDCTELASAMSLTISMVIDPLGKSRPSASASTSSPPPPPPKVEPRVIAPSPKGNGVDDTGAASFDRDARAGKRLRLGLVAVSALGFSPRVEYGASASIGLGFGSFSIDLEGRRDLPVTMPLGRGDATTSIFLATLAPCLHRGVFVGCALISAGSLQARGGGVDHPSTRGGFFSGLGVRGGVEWSVAPSLALVARVELLAPLVHTTLKLDGEEVWSTPALTASAGAGLIAFF